MTGSLFGVCCPGFHKDWLKCGKGCSTENWEGFGVVSELLKGGMDPLAMLIQQASLGTHVLTPGS